MLPRLCALLVLAFPIFVLADPDAAPTTSPAKLGVSLTAREFFAALDLNFPGLEKVKLAVQSDDLQAAKKELAVYFRSRQSFYDALKPFSPELPEMNDQLVGSAEPLLNRTGQFAPEYWLPNGQLDLRHVPIRFLERFYFWENLAKLYHRTHDERLAKAWVNLLESYLDQVPYSDNDPYWRTMHIGIQLRSAFPVAFHAFLISPSFTDEEIFRFLKRTLEQTRYLRQRHNLTSNQLTFEMAGLYTSGVMYPEFADAADWRHFAVETALADLRAGWLPDGMTIERSPGYGQFFTNYYVIHDLAQSAHRLDEGDLARLVTGTEPLFNLYIKVMTPDRVTPATNDNAPIDVPKMMKKALERFPDNALFQWAASDGERGTPPDYTSLVLPYAGFAAMRSDWSRDASMLDFDFGPVGYRHAHQDKLQIILWCYGRQILFDPGRGHYDDSPPRMQNYALDTFSHSTVLVDNRPQRRPWYTDPHPRNMPYQPVRDYTWESTPTFDYAAGIYTDSYGLPGESDADPYKDKSNFTQGWSKPAVHHRRVLFYKPDIFVVADTLIPNDQKSHTYDARWQLATTKTKIDNLVVTTTDIGEANLQIVPLDTTGLTIKATSAQESPELLGWSAADAPHPATTLQHVKSGQGPVQFVTLLLPLTPGESSRVEQIRSGGPSDYNVTLKGGRDVRVRVPSDFTAKIEVTR